MREVLLEHLPAQDEFFNADEREVAFVGGLATGKTHVASDAILAFACKYPRARSFIFSNTYEQLTAGTLTTFYERCEYWGLEYRERVRDLHKVFLPDIGASIEVRSVDQPIKFKSLEICFAWIDEAQAWPKDAYDKVLGRLRGTATTRRLYPDMPERLRITANPTHTFDHWLYELTHNNDPKTGKPPIRLITAATEDNPFIPLDYITSMRAQYDPEVAEAEMGGKFIEIGRGRCFRMFSRARHLLTREEAFRRGLPSLDYDPSLPLCWSHDFNLDPLCSVLFQWRRVNHPDYQPDVMFIYDSIRITDGLIQNAPQVLTQRDDAFKIARFNGVILYGDASGNQGNRQTGLSDWAALRIELSKLNLQGDARVPAANPSHRDRFSAANRQLLNADGKIGVVIVDNPNNQFLVTDMTRMYFKPGTFDVEIIKPKPGEIVPRSRQMTHLGDAFSYPIQYDYPYVDTGDSGSTSTQR